MKTILFACPYAVNIRNLFMTETAATLLEDPELRLVCLSAMDPGAAQAAGLASRRIIFERLEPYQPSLPERWLDNINRLLFLPYSDYLKIFYQPAMDRCPPLRAALGLAWHLGLHVPGRTVAALRLFRERVLAGRRYDRLIDDYRPDLVVVTRLFNTDEFRLISSAKRKGVPTAHVVASWDNLYSYAYMPVLPERLLCWNQIMVQDAAQRHGFPRQRAEVVGPPQFDIYFQKETYPPREEYFARLGLDPAKRLITFTTADILFDQPAMAQRIWRAVIQNHPDRQLMVRVHPQERSEAYQQLRESLPRLVLDLPGSVQAGSADRLFSRQDFLDLACCMSYSDLVINVCSTITLDASVADTPVICYRALDVYTDQERGRQVIEAHDHDHFAPLIACDGLTMANDDRELAELTAAYLADPSLHAQRRRRVTDLMVPSRDGKMSRRLGLRLRQLAEQGTGAGRPGLGRGL